MQNPHKSPGEKGKVTVLVLGGSKLRLKMKKLKCFIYAYSSVGGAFLRSSSYVQGQHLTKESPDRNHL